MQDYEALLTARDAARAYERALDPARRKQLGQFFSGVRLGRILVHLGIGRETRTVLDPMAGHGDLLDAAWEVAAERKIHLDRLDGIEIDDVTAATCRDRLAAVPDNDGRPESLIVAGNAFDPETIDRLPVRFYDLVITNPPYVRYQGRTGSEGGADTTRSGLKRVIDRFCHDDSRILWRALANGYSGLADLSVPAWILAGFMVRPGGRLALIVPATWRSRDYADVIRYLLLRWFHLEDVVADTQPGWFSDALVRTHLIVARRLGNEEVEAPLGERKRWPSARWLDVAPNAADERSLVGASFGDHPESAFASWLKEASRVAVQGIDVRDFDLGHEWATLRFRIRRHRWYPALEDGSQDLPLFSVGPKSVRLLLPDALRQILPADAVPTDLGTLEESGIRVGQGLRTGCNGFFYVTACGEGDEGMVMIKASSTLGGSIFAVPSCVLRPVLRRQSEIALIEQGSLPPGRVLDLRAWVLPEDSQHVLAAKTAYALRGETPPQLMNSELAAFVRDAALVSLDGTREGKLIPELSAVRTNVRRARDEKTTPCFWYMLPDFASRHLPAAFVPRINQSTPWIECNMRPPLLVDANFATFWVLDEGWSPFAMKALLNSVWCRAFMEATGTPLGGGALKLEATHLRQTPLPPFTSDDRAALHAAGKCLRRDADEVQARIDRIVLQALFPGRAAGRRVSELAAHVAALTGVLCAARQRTAS